MYAIKKESHIYGGDFLNIYSVIANAYDLLDILYFSEKGKNPREVINQIIPNDKVRVLDMCCGTLTNTINIAKTKSDINVMGMDLSRDMLKMARKKIKKQQIRNVYLKCVDVTQTGMQDKSVDYIIIGLVLHESSPELIKKMLEEAKRLLKDDGNLIVLEWEKPKKWYKVIKYSPLYLLETLNCKTFRQFYRTEKKEYFSKYGFKVVQEEHCNYSIVLNMKKK